MEGMLGHQSMYERDYLIHVDGALTPSSMGTGVEDWFNYGNSWRFVNSGNTSFSFIGAPHVTLRRARMHSAHSYRYQVTDPIPFHSSIKILLERTQKKDFTLISELKYKEYLDIKHKDGCAQSHLVLFYGRNGSNATETDILYVGNKTSENIHGYQSQIQPRLALKECGRTFSVSDKFYVGNHYDNSRHVHTGRSVCKGTILHFTLTTKFEHKALILRRHSYQKPLEWNTKAKIWVNGLYQGIWFHPKGSNTKLFSLTDNDHMLDNDVDMNSPGILNIKLETLTYWRDISYSVSAIL